MSEAEIINKLKERIRIDRSMRLNVESDFDRFCEEECRAIEGLIDLYNKEKEKNKELSEKVTQNICNRVEAEVLEEYRLKVQNSISKDKIRELLNKYDKASFIAKVDLQELLEERN